MLLPSMSTRAPLQCLRIVRSSAITRALLQNQDEFCDIVRSNDPEFDQKVTLYLELPVAPVGGSDISISEYKEKESRQ